MRRYRVRDLRAETKSAHLARLQAVRGHSASVGTAIRDDTDQVRESAREAERILRRLSGHPRDPPARIDYHAWRSEAVAQGIREEMDRYGRPLLRSSASFRDTPSPADPLWPDLNGEEAEPESAQDGPGAERGRQGA